MKIHRLQITQRVPASLHETWTFLSSPKNLRQLTPPWLDLRLEGEVKEELYNSQLIAYTMRPLFGLPMTWVTEIKQVYKGDRFIEEQKFGPFKLWHQEHFFRKIDGGTEIEDVIQYALPGGLLANVLHESLVRKRLADIFQFRGQAIEQRLGRWQQGGGSTPGDLAQAGASERQPSAAPQAAAPYRRPAGASPGSPQPDASRRGPGGGGPNDAASQTDASRRRPGGASLPGDKTKPGTGIKPDKPITLEDIFGPGDDDL